MYPCGWITTFILCCAFGAAAKPTTAPSSAKSPQIVRTLLAQLASEDAARRESARDELLTLQRTDLPALKEAIIQSRPLAPSQLAVLPDIVTHIYLAGETYASDGSGFMGIRLPYYYKPEERTLLSLERGVAVLSRIPGYCAYRMLQDGDVIIGIVEQPDVELNSPDQLVEAIKNIRAGQIVTFDVVRQGRITRVPVILDRRPTDLTATNVDDFEARRAKSAQEFWQKEFIPLLEQKVS